MGGGGIRVLVREGARLTEVAEDVLAPRGDTGMDLSALAVRLSALLARTVETTGAVRPGFDRVAIGLTGLPDLIPDPGELARRLRDRTPVETVVIAADAVTTHVGALGGRTGVVVAAGTGVVALGTDLDRTWSRSDGWGILLGDHGGGAWVGREGLQAALRAKDGRSGGSAPLLTGLTARFGDAGALEHRVYGASAGAAASVLATFAPDVAAAARAGDPVAARIWWEAGTHLGRAAVAAAAPGLERRFSWGGGLFAVGELVLGPLRTEVLRTLPEARFSAPEGGSVEGALTLAETVPARRPPHLFVFERSDPARP
ncbi:BadF/BadG/BcrA/BcrD ATPase family protein [Nocardiopsis sp. MG754419]|uniref:BadF/BadG/BcrA/BcrD ATPase family protein n=1 Tax=Nocardiopsis sp. MG754419 TaxID=2259865 RepID=UPI0027DABDCB|nr:BadF/BadG/BcrA/BcrD ATPase family protein [Nocardiopsis sp. MG754419]